jgi:serine/threonine-protein kinase
MADTSPPRSRESLWGEIPAGEVIAEKYEILRVLGRGGLGVVYAAKHLLLGEEVAIKFLRADLARDERIVARFTREARAASKIRSEHVARVLDVAVAGGLPYIVLELLRGSDLLAHVKQHKRVSVEDAALYLLQACEAVAEAHVRGIVHRDLKSANIFLTHRADGSPSIKVLDFGISKLLDEQDAGITTEGSSLMGSPAYMSPEQVMAAGEVDAQTDIWSLGVVFYELVTGKRPFSGDSPQRVCMAVLHDEPAPPSSIVAGLPKAADAIVLRCLQKKRAHRYLSVADLAADLAELGPLEGRISMQRARRILSGAVPPAPPSDPRAAAAATAAPGGTTTLTAGGLDASAISAPTVEPRARRRSFKTVALALIAAGIAAAGVVTAMGPRRGPDNAASSAALVGESTTPDATGPADAAPTVVPSATASAAAAAPEAGAAPEPTVSPAETASASVEPPPAPPLARPSKPRPAKPQPTSKPGPLTLPEDRQ